MLRAGNLDGALLIALERVDANATPEHAARLQTARQLDAAMGLIGAPIILIGLIGSALFAWLRYGRDPGLSRRSIDPHGRSAARPYPGSGDVRHRRRLVATRTDGRDARPRQPRLDRLPRREGDARSAAEGRDPVRSAGPGDPHDRGAAGPERRPPARARRRRSPTVGFARSPRATAATSIRRSCSSSAPRVDDFDQTLESHVVKMGWFREKPSKADGRWVDPRGDRHRPGRRSRSSAASTCRARACS